MTIFEEAVQYALEKHAGMTRKRTSTPYILHPLEVAVMAGSMTTDEEVLAAAVLHDTVEDAGATLQELEERFGQRVAALVATETEDKREGQPPSETWRIRKEESLEALRQSDDPGAKVLWLADKLSNLRAFHASWKISGDSIWESFNQKDPAQQAWYYRSIDNLLSDLRGYEAWQEYHHLVEIIFADHPLA